ncbi:MAG: nuclear transport factor 2 family protein, partial [Myxococcales bacterium]|nr:nuclear transport factor 2 family protein [Myxococcales bacterium]
MTMEELEARIRVLEDIEAIRKLKATYCDLCDAGLGDARNVEALVAHFTEDAKVDFGMGDASVFQGRDGIRIFFGQLVPGSVSFCMHMVH